MIAVDLQDGFFRDRVVVAVDGLELAHRDGVTTRTQLGFAATIELAEPAGTTRLDIALPDKGLATTIDLPAARPLWLGVSVADHGLVVRIQERPFGYV
ncbi:MAG: hypothetical protein HQL38_07180 [Alphaproteobacteria bacterium]|nr:hypothetical protein [Alphaproteobacteria bacterium]MBF0373062.1 hypothetical protein [Alphaproteobacteria bacterium]MBF0392447.1 hypothetical protein [Alphaproteobacteria bacterium]